MAVPAVHNSFPLVRGKKIRVTSLDNCCKPSHPYPPTPPATPPVPPFPVQYAVSSGFVSVALTAQINAGDEINVVNADGRTCVRDVPCPQFNGYGVEITFCEVQPCLYSMLTSQPVVLDPTRPAGEQIRGIQMNSDPGGVVGEQNVCRPFALEIWTGVPGMACTSTASAGMYGYLLLPCIQPGSVGDFTIENGAATFTITGGATKDGTTWGVGPWAPIDNAAGNPSQLPQPLDVNTQLHMQYTHIAPPEDTGGCVTADWTPPGVAVPAP